MSIVIEGIYSQSGQADQQLPLKVDSSGNMQVNASTRLCLGRQTIAVTNAAVSTLTVPVGAIACTIQADGGAISITLDGSTPTSTAGSRIDDGVFFYVDTVLASVKLIARASNTNVQVAYFNKA